MSEPADYWTALAKAVRALPVDPEADAFFDRLTAEADKVRRVVPIDTTPK